MKKVKLNVDVLFIVGPTASGKSKLALSLAKKLDGEIVSADSMQIYKGMDIGTAKATRAEQKLIRHHLIDILSPKETYSVYNFCRDAIKAIKLIRKRKKVPIVVGGTGLYVQALLYGLDKKPAANPRIRKKWEAFAEKQGVLDLYKKLKTKDLISAKKIKSTDKKRIIRALEVLEQKPSKVKGKLKQTESIKSMGFNALVVGLRLDREVLYERIDKRVDQMFRKGLYKEVEKIFKKKVSETAFQAVGYKEVWAAIQDEISIKEARELVKRNSRRLAKRQMTWFRKEKAISWIDLPLRGQVPRDRVPGDLAPTILKMIKEHK